jgi:hypothetical protein
VKPNKFSLGDQVLLLDRQIKPRSDRVLTHRMYEKGPYFIVEIVKGNDTIGEAFKLSHCESGKTLRNLVNGDRLKHYDVDRTDLKAKLPPLTTGSEPDVNKPGSINHPAAIQQPSDNMTTSNVRSTDPEFEPAIKILKQKMVKGKTQFLVQFDVGDFWCDKVTPALLKAFRIEKQSKNRRKKRRRRTD